MTSYVPRNATRALYLLAVSAKDLGIEALRDGGWHVVGRYAPNEGERARADAERLIPMVLEANGDLAIYRLGEGAGIILRKGGAIKGPAAYEDLRAYDEAVARELDSFVGREPEVVPAPQPRRVASPLLSICVAVACIAVGAGGAVAWTALGGRTHPRVAEFDVDQVNALLKGAIQITQVDPRDPDFMVTVRYYPNEKGEARPQIVNRFRTEHYERGGGYVPDPRVRWLKSW